MTYTIGQSDGAFILECSNIRLEKGETNNRFGRHRHNIIRPLAPFALNQLFVDRGIPSTVINYTDFWDPEILADTLCKWATKNNIKKPIILSKLPYAFETLGEYDKALFFDPLDANDLAMKIEGLMKGNVLYDKTSKINAFSLGNDNRKYHFQVLFFFAELASCVNFIA